MAAARTKSFTCGRIDRVNFVLRHVNLRLGGSRGERSEASGTKRVMRRLLNEIRKKITLVIFFRAKLKTIFFTSSVLSQQTMRQSTAVYVEFSSLEEYSL